jgi:hypothetical protein
MQIVSSLVIRFKRPLAALVLLTFTLSATQLATIGFSFPMAAEAAQTVWFSGKTHPLLDCGPENPAKKVTFRAFVRELHTYGQLLNIGEKNKDHSQHKGLGKKLLAKAEEITRKNKIDKLAVIAGVGVREYYRKWGYRLEKTYVVKKVR